MSFMTSASRRASSYCFILIIDLTFESTSVSISANQLDDIQEMYDDMVQNGLVYDGDDATSSSEEGNNDEDYEYPGGDSYGHEVFHYDNNEADLPCRQILIKPSHYLYEQMMSSDSELAFFPQRSFTFSGVNILVDQSVSDVGYTVWDAEIILAHYVNEICDQMKDKLIVELGAGTGLAGILCSKLGAKIVAFQELESCVSHTKRCCAMNIVVNEDEPMTKFVAQRWSKSCGRSLVHENNGLKFDYVIMADVLYHVEDFPTLKDTIMECLREDKGQVIICYEQRRKDLSEFFRVLLDEDLVLMNTIQEFSLQGENALIKYYLYHFKVRSKSR